MAAQGLDPDHSARTAVAATVHCAGVQAQDRTASRLAVRARSQGLTAAEVAQACDRDRTLVRTWLMRGTLHMVAAQDARWMLALLGPRLLAGQRPRRHQLGLNDATCDRLQAVAPAVLAAGPMTRSELVTALAQQGVAIEPRGQAPAHAVFYLSASGLTCRGPDRGAEPTYVLLDDWLGSPSADRNASIDDPARELAQRYFDAFAPASREDFQSWSGLPGKVATAAMAELDLSPVQLGGSVAVPSQQRLWSPGKQRQAQDGWRLLPAFDTYLLGYRRRDLACEPSMARLVYAGGGWIHPSVVRRGRIVGTWRLRSAQPATLSVEMFDHAAAARPAIEREAADIERFLERPIQLTFAESCRRLVPARRPQRDAAARRRR
jgi:Winged helix DNA-binding domain